MNIILNGETKEINSPSLAELLQTLNLNPEKIVVECNGQIISRDQYNNTILKDNDRLELVQFVGGG